MLGRRFPVFQGRGILGATGVVDAPRGAGGYPRRPRRSVASPPGGRHGDGAGGLAGEGRPCQGSPLHALPYGLNW